PLLGLDVVPGAVGDAHDAQPVDRGVLVDDVDRTLLGRPGHSETAERGQGRPRPTHLVLGTRERVGVLSEDAASPVDDVPLHTAGIKDAADGRALAPTDAHPSFVAAHAGTPAGSNSGTVSGTCSGSVSGRSAGSPISAMSVVPHSVRRVTMRAACAASSSRPVARSMTTMRDQSAARSSVSSAVIWRTFRMSRRPRAMSPVSIQLDAG